MISLENTKVAFENKSVKDLKRMRLLFKMISKNWIVNSSKSLVKIALYIHFPIKWIVKPTIFKHFCGGETLEDCFNTVNKLSINNVYSILDFSAESTSSIEIINEVTLEIIRNIKNAANNKNIPFAVFKPSALIPNQILEKKSNGEVLNENEKIEFEKFVQRINSITNEAYNNKVKLLIDAEYFRFQNIIDIIVSDMMEKYNKEEAFVFNTLQMYRKDRLQYLKNAHKIALSKNYKLGIKFVRGAYMEEERLLAKSNNYPSPIHDTKEETDNDFDSGIEYTVSNINSIETFCGTHNEKSCLLLAELIIKNNIKCNDKRIWFSQLYGMSDNISYNLAKEGFNIVKYIPYGPVKKVLPYLIRRAEENTSIKGQTNRELSLINKELNRRKNEIR
ncbi:MAG: proline dehydrogenase family protein [Bacteroidia bacterium]|nr:proline dehydrogenase family protein [Bacteroidia bacterium]